MASYTQNIDLQKLDPQDLFNEEVYNSNAEKIDNAIGGINSALGGTKIVRISREDYDSTEHRADTIYFVTEQDGSIKQYLGDVEISGNGGGGNAPSEATIMCSGITAEVGDALLGGEPRYLFEITKIRNNSDNYFGMNEIILYDADGEKIPIIAAEGTTAAYGSQTYDKIIDGNNSSNCTASWKQSGVTIRLYIDENAPACKSYQWVTDGSFAEHDPISWRLSRFIPYQQSVILDEVTDAQIPTNRAALTQIFTIGG